MTRDRSFSPEVMAMSLTPSLRELQKRNVTFTVTRNPAGAYQLFRIEDAVAARNTHAAIYDALRLCKVF